MSLVNRDRLTAARRSWNMSRIRGKDTSPELIVRSLLHRMGYRFRLHVRIRVNAEGGGSRIEDSKQGAEGRARHSVRAASPSGHSQSSIVNPRPYFVRPDIILPKHRVAIFVHGCFWHRHRGCKNCTTPTHRREWWLAKLEGNAARDKKHQRALRKLGWHVIVIWECQSDKEQSLAKLNQKVKNMLLKPSRSRARLK